MLKEHRPDLGTKPSATMPNIVAQSILQLNGRGCQDDNVFGQIESIKAALERQKSSTASKKEGIKLSLTAPATAGRRCRLLGLYVFRAFQVIERLLS